MPRMKERYRISFAVCPELVTGAGGPGFGIDFLVPIRRRSPWQSAWQVKLRPGFESWVPMRRKSSEERLGRRLLCSRPRGLVAQGVTGGEQRQKAEDDINRVQRPKEFGKRYTDVPLSCLILAHYSRFVYRLPPGIPILS